MPSVKDRSRTRDSSSPLDNPDDVDELIVEAEEVIEAIKNGEMEGEYFEF